MAGSRQKIIETLQSVDTVLITVGKNPSVDELSAALGLTIFLNESGKHATAVMSGDIPPAISFLEPEKTFENSVDSLRDFVIALDKDKADHLRYKLVDDVVKIFITPYRAVITEKDLRYSKGDYNVELVLAIGVKTRDDLDKALVSHGRILHDATVATIGNEESKLGDPDWYNREASSLSEMVATLITKFSEDKKMDKRVASALLTGIVSATDRFSNDRTSPESLTVAAELMSYGANQQLIALKLREGSKMEIQPEDGSKKLTRDLEKDSRKQTGNSNDNANNKKQNRREKDRTKLSIDHTDTDSEEGKTDNRNNQNKKPNNNNRPRQEKRQDKEPVKNESNPGVNTESKPEEKVDEKPVETTAPNRIGLTEDGEYNPAAALDEALRLSEQKRAEEVSEDKDKLADELARSLEQASHVQQAETPMPYELLDNHMPQVEETPQPEVTPQPEEPTQETEQPAPVQEETPQPYIPEQQYEPQPQQEPQIQPEQYEAPQSESSELPSLPPVDQSPIIGEVRQNNSSNDLANPDESPTFGGVLNATTESAAEAKKMLESEMRNRTILSRSTPGTQAQAENLPSTPPPFNSTVAGNEEPSMPSFDISAPQVQQPQQMQSQQQVFEPASNYTYQGQTIVPPTPTGTLEEIDRQHRQPQPAEDTEVRDMFEPSSQPLPAPSVPIGQPTSIQAPNTPPPPPMPDFSQLPPLPTQMPDFSQVPVHMPPDAPEPGPDNLGQILPPAPQMPTQNQQPNDPGQFQIPNQQQQGRA